jgi:SEC-C motif
MPPGRNDPCPCGSGKKYKKCHGAAPTATLTFDPTVARANAFKAADLELQPLLMKFSREHGGAEWFQSAIDEYLGSKDAEMSDLEMQLGMPWILFQFPWFEDGNSMARTFQLQRGHKLAPSMQHVLAAQLDAYLSIWDVTAITPGVGMMLHDLLTGAQQFVHEVKASLTVTPHTTLLALVVEHDGIAFLGGLYPQVLSPLVADRAVKYMRKLCRVRTRPVNPEWLRDPDIQLELVDQWRDLLVERSIPPTLNNTDGDPVTMVTDHYTFDAAQRTAVVDALATLDGAREPMEADDGLEIVLAKQGNKVHKSWDNTIIGRVIVAEAGFAAESNSVRRADALRRNIDTTLGPLAQHKNRDELSGAAMAAQAMANAGEAPSGMGMFGDGTEMPPEIREAVRQMREQHMLGWLDEQIPALNGKTPRQAAADPKSRNALEVLMREFEHIDANLPADERFDTQRLRDALGM